MQIIKKKLIAFIFFHIGQLSILHFLNDSFEASFLLLLPFVAKDLAINLTQVGFLGTMLNSLGIVMGLPAGYIAARIGGFKTLIIALVIYGLAFLGTGLSSSYFPILVMFIVGGIGYSLFHPIAFSLIAKWTPAEKRGQAMGNFTAVGDVGKIAIAPLLTMIIVLFGWKLTAIGYSLAAMIIAFYFYSLMKKDYIMQTEAKPKIPLSLWEVIKNNRFIFASLSDGIDAFASSSLYIFLPFLLLKRGVSPALLGSFAGAFFIGNFLGKVFIGRSVDKFGNSKIFILSEVFMAIFIFLLANSTSVFFIVAYALILGVFTKGTVPVTQTMVSEAVEHHGNFEKAFGVNEMVVGLAKTISPVMLGFISDKLGIVVAFNTMAVAALIAILPAIGFYLSKNTSVIEAKS